METVVSIGLGLGLSAACGFRVFVPLLGISLAALTGHLPLSPGFAWIGTLPAAIAFATATALEVLAYYIPWFDHALDLIATPTAVVAGMIASASVLTALPPLVKWSIVLIGGGGAAGLIQGATVLARLKSLAFSGGLANAAVSTLELFGAIATVLLALLLPLLCLALLLLLMIWTFQRAGRVVFGRRAAEAAVSSSPAAP